MTNHESYSNYQQRKPLSTRLSVEAGTTEPTNTNRRPKATAEPEALPEYIKPIRTSGKQQGTVEGTAGELKDTFYLKVILKLYQAGRLTLLRC